MKLVHFEKKLGLGPAVAITVGAVIGVGIFVIVGPIGARAGAWMPAAFAAAALPAVFGTAVAVALGSTIPADGGGYHYTKALLGPRAGAMASGLVVVGALGALAAVSVGVADYLRATWPELPRPAVAVGLVLLSWGVNVAGVMTSVRFQVVMVLQLVSALLLVVVAGLLHGATPDFGATVPGGVGGFLEAAAIAGLSFVGFNIIGELGDEIEDPHRNVALTVIIGLGIITTVYVGVGWVVAGTLDPETLGRVPAALLDTARQHLPPWALHYLTLAALTGAITSINAVFLAVPRELVALSDDALIPAGVARFDAQRQTFPVSNALVATAGSVVCLLDLDPDVWGLVCVGGLLAANVLFSVGALRLFARFPERVAAAPFPVRRGWVFPAALLSALTSAGFVALAAFFFWPVAALLALVMAAGWWRGGRR